MWAFAVVVCMYIRNVSLWFLHCRVSADFMSDYRWHYLEIADVLCKERPCSLSRSFLDLVYCSPVCERKV